MAEYLCDSKAAVFVVWGRIGLRRNGQDLSTRTLRPTTGDGRAIREARGIAR